MNNIKAVIFDLDNTLVNRTKAFTNFCISFLDYHFKNKNLPDNKDNMIQYMTLLDNNGYCNRYEVFKLLIDIWNIRNYSAQQLCDSFNDEFNKLTKIGNDFRIRHHETYKIDIQDIRHYDYFFNRCLALIATALQYLQ